MMGNRTHPKHQTYGFARRRSNANRASVAVVVDMAPAFRHSKPVLSVKSASIHRGPVPLTNSSCVHGSAILPNIPCLHHPRPHQGYTPHRAYASHRAMPAERRAIRRPSQELKLSAPEPENYPHATTLRDAMLRRARAAEPLMAREEKDSIFKPTGHLQKRRVSLGSETVPNPRSRHYNRRPLSNDPLDPFPDISEATVGPPLIPLRLPGQSAKHGCEPELLDDSRVFFLDGPHLGDTWGAFANGTIGFSVAPSARGRQSIEKSVLVDPNVAHPVNFECFRSGSEMMEVMATDCGSPKGSTIPIPPSSPAPPKSPGVGRRTDSRQDAALLGALSVHTASPIRVRARCSATGNIFSPLVDRTLF